MHMHLTSTTPALQIEVACYTGLNFIFLKKKFKKSSILFLKNLKTKMSPVA